MDTVTQQLGSPASSAEISYVPFRFMLTAGAEIEATKMDLETFGTYQSIGVVETRGYKFARKSPPAMPIPRPES